MRDVDAPSERIADPAPALGVAVVGAGYWGPNLVRNFLNHPDWDLKWVCDVDLGRATAALRGRSGARVTSSLEDVLADDSVVALAVCTPPRSHLELGRAILESGRHLLMEKPLATSVEEAEILVSEADHRGLALMCDHTFCFTPPVQTLRTLMVNGSIGDLYYLDSIRMNLGLVQSDVDVFWDLAPHDLSVLDFVLPPGVRPLAVSAYGADPIGAGKACVGYLTIPLSTGAVVHVSVNWLSPSKVRQMIVAGSKSMVIWDDMKPYQRLTVVDCGVDLRPPALDDAKRDLMVSYRMGDMVIPALTETGEALQGVISEFASVIRSGRAPLTDGHSGVRVLKLLEAATESMKNGSQLIELET
jgi:predicted dehydrogenase